MRVGIIGAGMAGLSCAKLLSDNDFDVRLLDKGRGAGGRMSTRRMDTAIGEAAFDFGAQYFTARDSNFLEAVQSWQKIGLVAPWSEAGPDAWVGVPAMNSIIKHLANGQGVDFGQRVSGLDRVEGDWHFALDSGSAGPFDITILAVPAEQAATLVSLHDFDLARSALHARSKPCWTGLFAFVEPITQAEGIVRDRGIIAWAARNSGKPGRTGPESWVVQAQPSWTEAHLEDDRDAVASALLEALGEVLGQALPPVAASGAHRWRFAMSHGTGEQSLWSSPARLGICGDWLIGPRVEAAWLSGQALAHRIIDCIDREVAQKSYA